MVERAEMLWYEGPETQDEYRARHDRFGQPMYGETTPWDRIVERAHELVRPLYRRPPRGIAMPFGIPAPQEYRWRLSPDVAEVLRAHVPGDHPIEPLSPMAETLFGIALYVDYKSSDGTIELVER